MDITKHIKNKKNIMVCNLSKNGDIQSLLGLDSYRNIESMDNYNNTVFCDDDLLILLLDKKHVVSQEIFKKSYSINNILIFINDLGNNENNLIEYKNILFSYGYKYFGNVRNENIHFFTYDIADYKDNPDWLNNSNWANPELWEK